MKSNRNKEIKIKRSYTKPKIECVKLDNEISMVMMSAPPADPDGSLQPDNFSINPFKMMKF